ncbi:MAG: multidrug effflux MFS transporter [Novosphingobium sp.]|nr:multidrug effflux MFS transporter [Novosphingobium sp.]
MHAPASTSSAFRLGMRELVVMLALTQALQALAIDAMLPALGQISADLHLTDPNQRQLIVGLFLVGAGVGSLLPGALADRYGRRPVLLGCLASYVVFGLACAIVSDFRALLAMRMLQALGSGGLAVLPVAIIRDKFEGDRMARLQSLMSMIFMVVPMLAPTLGQAVLVFAGWRWIFGLMAVLALMLTTWIALRLPETLHPEFRQAVRVTVIADNLLTTLRTRASIGYVFGAALVQGTLFGYVQCSEQLIAEHFGAGTRFPLVFGGMALCMATANFTNSRIVERFGARRVGHTATLAYIVVGALQVGLAHLPHQTLWEFVPVMTANMCLIGFIGANFSSIALQPFARIAGSASSVQAFIRVVLASLLGALIGQAYDNSARPLAFALLLAGIGSLALVLYSERGTLFRRLHYPARVPA